jgi:hypothetical protein
MSDHRFWGEKDRMAGIPNPPTQIHFLVVVEKLLVEATQIFEEVPAKHYATARLPIDGALRIAAPARVFLVDEIGGQPRKAKRRDPVPPDCREKARGNLISSVRVQDAATEGSSFRMAVCKLHESVQGTFMDDSVGI